MVYISGGNELLNPAEIYQHLGLEEGMKVADLGCGGSGLFTITAAKFVGRNGIIFAVDILKSVLKEVSKKARLEGINNIKIVWANLETYGAVRIDDNELNMAFLVNVLFQSKEHKSIIKEAVRIIKPGGKLLIVDWGKGSAPFGPSAIDRVESDKIKNIAQSANLKLIDEFDAGNYHYGLIFKK